MISAYLDCSGLRCSTTASASRGLNSPHEHSATCLAASSGEERPETSA